MLQNPPKCFKILQMLQNVPKCSNILQYAQNTSKWSQRVPNGPLWSKMMSNGVKWFQMIQMVLNDPKWSQMGPNGQNGPMGSNVVQYGPNCQKWVRGNQVPWPSFRHPGVLTSIHKNEAGTKLDIKKFSLIFT